MSSREDLANSRFNCSVRERACFEAGIKMGTIYHQFVGTPFSLANVSQLEKAIEGAVSVQPYVSYVRVKISTEGLVRDGDTYSYKSLTGEMIDAVVKIKLEGTIVTAEMRYDAELGYPLMYISKIE